jgi:hypothetical protein
MALRFSDKPTVNYGQQANSDSWRERFPAHARPISEAPTMGSQPLRLYTADGKQHLGLHHCGAWRGVSPVRDAYSGQTTMRMDGSLITAVLWSS